MIRLDPPRHILLRGRGREYGACGVDGPLSIKTVRRGSARWKSGGREWTLSPDRYLVLNEGSVYDVEIDAIDPVETFCVFFPRGFAEDVIASVETQDRLLLADPGIPHPAAVFHEVILPASSVVRGSLERLVGSIDGDDVTDDLAALIEGVRAADTGVRLRAHRLSEARPSTRSEILRRVLRARDRIESEWSTPLRLDDLARTAAMSPHHFHRKYRECFGETPLGHLTRVRLEHARRLLRESEATVQDVCLAVGLESQPSFTRLFRSRIGTTPGAYRARFRKIE